VARVGLGTVLAPVSAEQARSFGPAVKEAQPTGRERMFGTCSAGLRLTGRNERPRSDVAMDSD
jgi:hypothetical protein